MPDRDLATEELQKFINEAAEGEIGVNALQTFNTEKTKPTLHDLCIIELYAMVKAQTQIIIQNSSEIWLLKERIKALEK